MNPSVKAILARCNGDRDEAAEYCVTMMNTYPHLYDEYAGYLHALNQDAVAAAVGSGI